MQQLAGVLAGAVANLAAIDHFTDIWVQPPVERRSAVA